MGGIGGFFVIARFSGSEDLEGGSVYVTRWIGIGVVDRYFGRWFDWVIFEV